MLAKFLVLGMCLIALTKVSQDALKRIRGVATGAQAKGRPRAADVSNTNGSDIFHVRKGCNLALVPFVVIQ